jgi:hypothetical protein
MANSFDSNFTRKLARVFLEKFESERVMSKNVNTQLLTNKFNPTTGDTIDFKRPTDYTSTRTAAGDITGTRMDIVTGKASGTVQNYFTVVVDYDEADEAIKMDQIDQLLAPMATRIATDLELDFASFMHKNSGLLAGTYGTAVTTWSDVAAAGSVMHSAGIPTDGGWCYAVNPYVMTALASDQRSLGASDKLVKDANDKAVIAENFAGLRVMSATTLPSLTSGAGADRAGTITGSPDSTYVTHKDTMIQDIAVTAMDAVLPIKAGEIVQITGVNRLNLSTRQAVIDGAGANVLYTGVVTEDVTLSGGAGTIKVAGPAIYEATGAYNTVDAALATQVITVLGSASTLYQPSLFWHKQAFSMGSVPIKKLHSTDTLATTEDGLQFRVSKYADGDANKQVCRIDFRPAYACLNPFFAGQGWG